MNWQKKIVSSFVLNAGTNIWVVYDPDSVIRNEQVMAQLQAKVPKVTKNNNMMAFISLEDLYGTIECIIFPAIYDKNYKLIEEDKIVLLEGRLAISEVEDPKIIADRISPITKMNLSKVYLKLSGMSDTETLDDVKEILGKFPGDIPVYVYFEKERKTVAADRSLWIDGSQEDAIKQLQERIGNTSVKMSQ